MAELTPTPKNHVPPTACSDETGLSRRITLIKADHRWSFRWEAGGESLLIDRIAELARDRGIPFDWFDAAVLCKHIAQSGKNASAPGISCAFKPDAQRPNPKLTQID